MAPGIISRKQPREHIHAGSGSTTTTTSTSPSTAFQDQEAAHDEADATTMNSTINWSMDEEDQLTFLLDSITRTGHHVTKTGHHQHHVMRPFQPQRSWLWRQWHGTILQHTLVLTTINTALSLVVVVGIRLWVAHELEKAVSWSLLNPFSASGSSQQLWALGLAPDLDNHPFLARFAVLEKVWKLQLGFVTFALTFFLGQAYSFWREVYHSARQVQGSLNDIHLVLATHVQRTSGKNHNDNHSNNHTNLQSYGDSYSPEAKAFLTQIGKDTRLFHILFWASQAKQFRLLLTPTGLDRMVQRGILTSQQLYQLRQLKDVPVTEWHPVVLQWIMLRWTRAIHQDPPLIDTSRVSVGTILLQHAAALRSAYSGIHDKLAGRMPLAYVHLLQLLTDILLLLAPLALYSQLEAFSVLSVVVLTIFFGGFLDLGKVLLDPLHNEPGYCSQSMYLDLSVFLRESNADSVRWRDGAEILPWS